MPTIFNKAFLKPENIWLDTIITMVYICRYSIVDTMKQLVVLIPLFLAIACTPNQTKTPAKTEQPQAINTCDSLQKFEMTDDEMYQWAFSKENFFPGHFKLELKGHYLNSVHFGELNAPICANTADEALAQFTTSNPENYNYQEAGETDKYYIIEAPEERLWQHVYKCSYFKPKISFERPELKSWTLGSLAKTPVTEADARDFIEYYNFVGKYALKTTKVVNLQTCQLNNTVYVIQAEVQVTPIDRTNDVLIDLFQVTFTINAQTGEVVKTKSFVRRIRREKPQGE